MRPPPHSASPRHRPAARWGIRRSRRTGEHERGQSLVEFSLILLPLFLLLLGIVQFGFIFNTYVTLSTAAREGAREGSIYVYDRTISRGANDTARNNAIKTSLMTSLNGLSKSSPQFANGSTWTTSTSGGTTVYTNGDLQITYELPSGVTDTDARTGYQITVKVTYHQDLVVPLVSNLLPKDANGRLGMGGEVTMVVN